LSLTGLFPVQTYYIWKLNAAKEPANPTRYIMRQSVNEIVFWHLDSFKINPKPDKVGAGHLYLSDL